MNDVDAIIKRYTTQQFRLHPVVSLAKLMGLDAYLGEIKQRQAEVYPILCGLVMYRCLDGVRKHKVLRSILAMPRDELMSVLHAMVSQIVAFPYMYCWDLRDDEVREFFKVNHDLLKVFDTLGGKSVSAVIGSFTVIGVAGTIFDFVTKKMGYVSSVASDAIKMPRLGTALEMAGVSSTTARMASGTVGSALLLVAFLHENTKDSVKQARKELILRGLIKMDDI